MGDATLGGTGEAAPSITQSIAKYFIIQMDICAKMTGVTAPLTTPRYVTHTISGGFVVTNLVYDTIGSGMSGQSIPRFWPQEVGMGQTGINPVKNY